MICQYQLSLVSMGLKIWNVRISKYKTIYMASDMTRSKFFLPPLPLLTGFKFSGVTNIASNECAKNASINDLNKITLKSNIFQ